MKWLKIAVLFIALTFYSPVYADSVSFTDMADRKITIPRQIQRVVPLGSAMRFMTYMQAVDKVVGIEAYEKKNKGNPGRPYSLVIADKVDAIPTIGEGGPGRAPDFEKIIAVKPDLIIAMGLDITLVETIQQKTAIPVLVLSYGGAGVLDFEALFESLKILGKLLDKENRAEHLINYIKSLKSGLHKRTSSVKKRPSVYVGAVSFKGRHGITSTQGDYMPLKWINAYNVADELKKSGPVFVDKEMIHKWDPDILFLDMGGIDLLRDDYQKNPDFYKKLKAVRQGSTFSVLPFNFYHTNIEIALSNAYYMAKVIYPEQFKDINPIKKADEIYKTFIGMDAYERLKKEYHGFGRVNFTKDTITIE